MLSLQQLNAADRPAFIGLLAGLYGPALRLAEQAWAHRPFQSAAHLKHVLCEIVRSAGPAWQRHGGVRVDRRLRAPARPPFRL
jgi:2-oxo-4-hydroxy-4-carboxy--5-ureidoimidazoline (OHCU) decarboxylase